MAAEDTMQANVFTGDYDGNPRPRFLPDSKDAEMYRLGFMNALEMCERIARVDHRVSLAKECGLVPGWQKGRWQIADAIANIIKIKKDEAKDARPQC